MQGLQIKLPGRFGRNKFHRRALHCFGDHFRIATMWNESLPISMPITVIALSSFSFAFDAPCQFGFMAGLEHGPDHPILGHYRIAAIALHRYRGALRLRHRCIGQVPEKGCKTFGTTGIVVARFSR
jgi:hypothetical protein